MNIKVINVTNTSIDWYKKLDPNQRINLREVTELLCGVPFKSLLLLFNLLEVIQLLYDKLKIEGFAV